LANLSSFGWHIPKRFKTGLKYFFREKPINEVTISAELLLNLDRLGRLDISLIFALAPRLANMSRSASLLQVRSANGIWPTLTQSSLSCALLPSCA
jgi:hypothetical protein